ncbi:TIGR03808 family TAT-translocated repetitive protein [Methylosinus sp. H3A]|uniref:TIGR03808 family TAT-translocated repetitive protein n=1 Tax=Methylosinus sp. H3A TaxID=2785786 RepID=UPI0018C2AF5D|nr:TIGR03808 family TAT-translocated repetitive protein [Methylosinus sp. H3A]MBG0807837.1 TIGR03808 family TAT-translocated repetitive protein [Methylosinus sp. H3A]MBG0807858.1 TIGR03808 family TAT-translocated repetitive protein [Methylosinus sp. H3A]
MALYTKVSDTAVVLQNASSSPGTGWSTVANVQSAFDQARSGGLPLFIKPGVYTTTEILVNSSTGGGQTLSVYAIPGTVVLQLTSGNNILTINGIYCCKIDGINFNGSNVNFTNLSDSSALLSVTNAPYCEIINNQFYNSVACGVYVSGSACTIRDNLVYQCSYGIWAVDATSRINGNTVQNCANNGILIWTSTVTGNGSIVSENNINGIQSGSGTGQNGNGILVFRAVAVTITANTISGCQYSAIRCNGGGDFVIQGNNCYGSREMAIFIEAPTAGIDLNGAVVSGNIIDTAGNGIAVANSGTGGQGAAKSVAITGNRVTNIIHQTINDPGYVPTVSIAFGIYAEGAAVISGNLVDGAAGIGINPGHNASTHDLNVNGNLVLNSPIGIGYSAQSGAGQIVISSNQIQGATGGAIVSVVYDDSTGTVARVSGSTDYGNQYDAQIGNVFMGNNRSY